MSDRKLSHTKKLARTAYGQVIINDPCAYCGGPSDTVDHIVPLASGGADDLTNITAACGRCNSGKRSKSLLAYLAWRSWVREADAEHREFVARWNGVGRHRA